MNKVLLIEELLKLPNETEYFDFKREWHHQNVDLIHDILCLSNSDSNHDRYLIIGIEDKSNNIIGVSSDDPNRKNQQKLLDLLKSANFNQLPIVSVESRNFRNKEIDIIEIKNSINKPFFLTKDYSKGDNKLIVRGGVVYTRYGDVNTPKTGTATDLQIEKMYKQRFGFFLPIDERFLFLLKDNQSWAGSIENKLFYNKNFPEFKISISDHEECGGEGYSCFFSAWENNYIGKLTFIYNTSEIFNYEYFYADNLGTFFPTPKRFMYEWEGGKHWYYYFILDSFEGLLLKILYSDGKIKNRFDLLIPIMTFENEEEHKLFKIYLKNKKCLFDSLKENGLLVNEAIFKRNRTHSDSFQRVFLNAIDLSKFYQIYSKWKNKEQ